MQTVDEYRVKTAAATAAPGLASACALLAARVVIVILLLALAFVLVEAWRPDLVVRAFDSFAD